MDTQKINRLRIPKLTFQFTQERNVKLIIFRNDRSDLPHLTISFANPSKEIDIHLKSRSSGGKEHLTKIAKIHENDIAKTLGLITSIFLQKIADNINKIKKVRPGWLARKGYWILYLDETAEKTFINYFAPIGKRHGKWERQINSSSFDNYLNSTNIGDNIYYPSFLHELASSGYGQPVFAFRVYGKHKPMVMPIGLIQRNGKAYWIRMDKFTKNLVNLDDVFLSCLSKILPEDVRTKISNALCLEELM